MQNSLHLVRCCLIVSAFEIRPLEREEEAAGTITAITDCVHEIESIRNIAITIVVSSQSGGTFNCPLAMQLQF